MNDVLDFLLDSKKNASEHKSTRLLVLGPSQGELIQCISYLKCNFNLDSESINLTNGGLNYTFLFQKEGGDPNTFHLDMMEQVKMLEIYSILDPLPNSSDDLAKLISVLNDDLEDIHLLYMLNTTSDQNSIFSSIGTLLRKRKVDYLHLAKLLKAVFAPITKYNFKSVNIIVNNVSSWVYDSITMPYVDFCQQIIRSAFTESINEGKLIYTEKEIDFNDLNENLSGVIKSILYDKATLSVDSTVLVKYSNLTIDSRFDTSTRIKHLDETFDWEGQWRSKWMEEEIHENTNQSESIDSKKSESIKDYFNDRIQLLAKFQSEKSRSDLNALNNINTSRSSLLHQDNYASL